jgi:hypothetical protein
MSLKTNKDNIYVFSPHSRYIDYTTNEWNSFMEKDFTIVVDLKIDFNNMAPHESKYFISRNGKHAGLACYVDASDNVHLMGTYYFWKHESIEISGKTENVSPISIEKSFTYCIPIEEKYKSHTFVITCDDTFKKLYYYMDNILLGEIDYTGLEKHSYKNEYMYLGCGTMLSDDPLYNCIGEYEYYFLMCLDKCISINEIQNLKTNYKEKYYEDYFGFPILKNNTPYKENICIFIDFEYVNNYKIWNSSFNGCIPNLYIKDNTLY